MHRESGYECYKEPEGVRWVQERQLVFSCMELLTLQSSQVWWERWPTEGRMLRSCGDWLLYVFWYAVDSDIVCLWGCLAHIVYLHGQLCIMYSAEGYMTWSTLSRIKHYSGQVTCRGTTIFYVSWVKLVVMSSLNPGQFMCQLMDSSLPINQVRIQENKFLNLNHNCYWAKLYFPLCYSQKKMKQ